jgi:hypothetical protein
MSNYKITYAERGPDIQLPGMEIVTDEQYDDRIEIYKLNDLGERVEGGTFKLDDFMAVVEKFYNDNY